MRGGLFTGFEAFQVPSAEDKRKALKEGFLAVDTNVLLNLYRYRPTTAKNLLLVLEATRDRLFIPNQVVHEFWRNRQSVISGLGGVTKEAHSALAKNCASTRNAISDWARRTAFDSGAHEALLVDVDTFFESLMKKLQGEPSPVRPHMPTDEDWLLRRLSPLLDGAVGAALSPNDWDAAVAEGRRRVKDCEPPGYKDADKADSDLPEGPAGDYLVWHELLLEGESSRRDLVLVQADTKEDWWNRDRSQLIGPRHELVGEYFRRTGRRFHLLTPADLLELAPVVGVGTNQESVTDVRRFQSNEENTEVATRTRQARSVHVIVDNELLEAGTSLYIDLTGTLDAGTVQKVTRWIEDDPDRGRATWIPNRNRPLRWCADSDPNAATWAPTGLAQHIITEATGGTGRITLSGPDVWMCDGRSLYGIASDFLGEAE